jgi:type IV pilus assembly protein PilC
MERRRNDEMPYFLCRLSTDDGKIYSRSVLAASSAECRHRFEAEGLCVLSARRDWKKFNLSFGRGGAFKDRDFIMFNQEFQALVKAGFPVLRSLEIIEGRTRNPFLQEVLRKVEADISQGKALSEAFAPFERRFTKIYTAALMAGEQSGNLPDTLGQYIQYARTIARTKSRIRSALIYPTMLLLFSLALVGVLINFVLPNFSSFYQDFDAQLPFFTVFLIDFSKFVRSHWPVWILLTGGAILGYFQLKRREKTLLWVERNKLKIPLGKLIWVESGVSLYCRTLSLLLQAGIPVLAGLPLAIHAIPNKFLASKAAEIPDHIRNGEALSESMAQAGFFPQLALDMVRIGETSGNLGGMLREVSEVFDERIQTKIDTFVGLIEPVMIIVMGVLVAGMLLSVYMPIFNIIKVAR